MKINILNNKIGWFGRYSGYECLPQYFTSDVDATIYAAKYNLANKVIGKIAQYKNKSHHVGPEEMIAELRFKRNVNQGSLSHVMYLEQHFRLLSSFQKLKKKLVATIHIPTNYWDKEDLKVLSKIDHAIVLYEEEIKVFSEYMAVEKISLIKHGIDISFFKPGQPGNVKKNKILFVGFFLRNFEMFSKVYSVLCKQPNKLEFHFIIPGAFRKNDVIQNLLKENNIFFHENLTDEELLEHYQDSYVLLMPMQDSGANTAIIQALATGLPIITTNVGGIKTYGGGDIFPLVKNNDNEAMINLFETYYNDVDYRNDISKKQRDFAVRELDWNLIAKEHISLYKKIGHS